MSAAAGDFRAVVVAAGQASRFADPLPKQFHDLAGRSVLERAVASVADRPGVGGVVVVLAADRVASAAGSAARRWPGVVAVVAGGASRCESVWLGVEAVGTAPFVLVHDGARPFAPAGLVDAVIAATRRHGAAAPVLEVSDTVKAVAGDRVTGTVPRDNLRLAQTPQGARRDWLQEALARARSEGTSPTDEAAALERDGRVVATVRGDVANRKITTAADLTAARRWLAVGPPTLRVGTGFDLHRVDATRALVLGGIAFEGEPGLAGHSDADVVLHAAMDALLGAVGLGDIGAHFPPDDERFAGADSTGLARRVAGMLAADGWRIVNLDLTLLAERPRIRERVEVMRASIAACLGIDARRVGLKATTLEGLGALGRGEGMACQAVALVEAAGGPEARAR
jgi:2-C-methyl-D-erythritol 4-phosphate cytidylyltransferase/2-C-methyl-D-erythritol 2,4-cyclodiphosphate synthase